jgi:hypothetical protein
VPYKKRISLSLHGQLANALNATPGHDKRTQAFHPITLPLLTEALLACGHDQETEPGRRTLRRGQHACSGHQLAGTANCRSPRGRAA